MKIFRNFQKKFANDRATLKSLPFRQKIRFILDYYKGAFFIFLCLCLLGYYLGDMWLETRRDTVLEGFFSNDDENLFPAQKLADDFSAYLGLAKGQQIIFDDSLYVITGSSADYNTASQGKIMAYVSARELDFLVTTGPLVETYAPSFPIQDLEEFLPDDMLERFRGQLLYAADGTGKRKACALSLEGSRFTRDSAAQKENPHYLIVYSYTKHKDTILKFLRYAFEMDPEP